MTSIEPVDLDEARMVLADNGIDGPDQPYNPRALHAMRVADALLAEVGRLRGQLVEMREQYDAEIDWQNTVAGRVPEVYEASEGAQSACIDQWLDDVCRIVDAALNCRARSYAAASVAALDAAIAATPRLDPRVDDEPALP